ncbi:MAG: EAL domain-containing protein [Gammaproteobacteria bacterium]|jgi:diguanylate cyclase (GGDEF)-like protein/PAS domain S-box-containing protein|nr:EAL domain-containing protein [Gammaproteobacteria bacterium]
MTTEAERPKPQGEWLDELDAGALSGILLDVIPGIFYLLDSEGRLLLWNERLEDLTGFTGEQARRMTVPEFFDEPQRADVVAAMETCLATGRAAVDASVRTARGASPPHHFQARRVEVNGRPLVAGVALDVSRLRAVEADHARQRVQLERLATHVPGVVYQLQRDADTGRLWMPYASGKFREVFGIDFDSVAEDAAPLFERIHPRDHDRVMASVERSADSIEPFFESFRMFPAAGPRADEQVEWVEVESGPERLGDGSVMWHGFARLVTHRRRLERKLTRLAYYDDLTGLPNRAHLQSTLRDELDRAAVEREGLAVLYLDLDNFNDINDAWSHAAGDRLLQEVATRLDSLVSGQGLLGRVGGDEFLLVLRGEDARERAETLGEEICRTMEAPMRLDQRQVRMTISIGISLFPDDADSAEDLVRHADAAVYKAKADGPGRWARYTRELTEAARARRYLETELRNAIEREQIQVSLQPIVKAGSDEVVAVEALARWYHWEDGWLSPDRFVAMAEKRGLVAALGELVYRRAMRAVAATEGQNLAINVSPSQLQDPAFCRRLLELGEECGLGPDRLEVELTERAFVREGAEAFKQIRRLRDAGISVTIDDFGTGFSSLGYLRRLPVQHLKIDRTFVRHVEDDPASAAIIRAVTSLAHDLGMQVTAEGVETAAEAEFVRKIGCDFAQGWYYGRPKLVE